MALYYPVMAGKRKRETSKPPGASKKKVSSLRGRKSAVHDIKRFPIQDIHKLLETKFPGGTVKAEGAVYLTGILEYLAAEILELSVNVARDRTNGRSTGLKVTLEDMLQAIESDENIKELIDKVRKANNENKQ
ncbi:hypothetical protein AVEN_97456-1 [Araneus ventricosus]|uniref:Histone H2A n=1 Tax=Araneus ventricosus TaxID=182803 RepID=A0A4Y2Q265_ARAVE|nr:hypothetical protein AVEN_97456-1 [Araneus ventricosus]